ncbi:hypothetical protein [Streptomyces sp. 3213.3]|uniref:hypothetical protein n=1 Tax=Streptomyces sp. 3213.3 TaxID=1855348 RepID=UPI00190E618B|nr:hypothetical protein [Streptomyces sp. 3213.3]
MDVVFFDDGYNACGAGNQFPAVHEAVNQYEEVHHPGARTVLHPGTVVPPCYEDSADVLADGGQMVTPLPARARRIDERVARILGELPAGTHGVGPECRTVAIHPAALHAGRSDRDARQLRSRRDPLRALAATTSLEGLATGQRKARQVREWAVDLCERVAGRGRHTVAARQAGSPTTRRRSTHAVDFDASPSVEHVRAPDTAGDSPPPR